MTTRFTVQRGHALRAGTLLLALAAACAKKDATADTADTAAAAAGMASAQSANSQSANSSAMTQSQTQDVQNALHDYRLTEDNVNKVIDVTQKLQALQKSNPQLVAAMKEEHGDANDAKSLDDAAARLDAMPPVHAVLSSAGLSARDYLLTTFTLMEAGAAYSLQKAGKLPPNSELAKDVSAENLAYVGTHQAQLKALEKANSNGGEG